ncbi:BcABA1- cytochrome P450 monooxygenase [Apiospora hydei]|uniref:BcABA1- cytochrome P450 monooxygenase n=1 Tax=Apiospora hydei TaxID=1337664 RepID=A0ABR1UVR5_9PEZI
MASVDLEFLSKSLGDRPLFPSPLAAPSYYAAIVGVSAVLWYVLTSIAAWYRLRGFRAVHWSAHFSYFWAAKTAYGGQQYWVHRVMFDQYKNADDDDGTPLLRIGPNQLITNDPDIVRRINAARSGYDRDPWYSAGRFNPYYDNMFSVLSTPQHARWRTRTSHAYTGREVPDFEAGVNEQLATFLERLRAYAASSDRLLDFGPMSSYFTVDVITRLAFGKEFGFLAEESDKYNFLTELTALWPRMATSADVPWIRAVLFSKPVLKLMGPKGRDKTGFGALMGVAEKEVAKRFAPGAEKKKDMLISKLMARQGSFMNHGLNQTECEVEGLFMVISGTESTASAIRCIMTYAMATPSVYVKLKAEIQAAVRDGRVSSPIKVEEARRLPYLQAVIYEGIRMRPPLLGLLAKVVPAGGDTLAGKHVPAGTAICTNFSSLLRSTKMFGADADVYRPERFMELGAEDRVAMERNTELAFGSGQWQCVGRVISFMEMNKIVFETFRHFDLQLACPVKACAVESYGVFLESNMMVRVTNTATY